MTERNSTMESSKSYFGSGKEVRESVGGIPVVFNTLAGGGRVQYTTAKPEGNKEFYLTDHLGSTREVYDLSTGNITYTSQYYPYGKQFSEYKSQAENTTEKFTGKEFEEGIGAIYFGKRYYDPDIASWTSADKMRQYFDSYNYVGRNPINNIDPDGNCDMNCNYPLSYGGNSQRNAAIAVGVGVAITTGVILAPTGIVAEGVTVGGMWALRGAAGIGFALAKGGQFLNQKLGEVVATNPRTNSNLITAGETVMEVADPDPMTTNIWAASIQLFQGIMEELNTPSNDYELKSDPFRKIGDEDGE